MAETLPRVGSRWRRESDEKVYVVTLAQRSFFGTGPKVILVEEITGYPRVHTTPSALKKFYAPVEVVHG